MDNEEIKSPLPARRIELPEEPEMEQMEPEELQEKPEEEPIKETEETGEFVSSVSAPKPKKDNKKLFIIGAIVLVVVIILFILFGVLIPSLKKGTQVVTLNYWGLWEDSSVVEGIIADFEAKNPGIKINYTKNQKDDYRTRLAGRLAKSGTETDVPDIFRIHGTWIPMFRTNLAPVPQTTMKSMLLDTDFFDVYKQDLVENGSYLAIPLMYDGLALFYNKDLINAAQVDLPKSWWNLENAANKLTVKDENEQIKVAGVALGLVDNVDHWSDIVGLMMKQNGVNPLLNDEANNKKLQDVLAFYTLFKTKNKVWDASLPPSTQAFASGKLAFYFAPSWRVFDIQSMNPNLNFEITTVPQLPTLANVPLDQVTSDSDLTNIHWASYWVEGVNNRSKYQKEAWKFLEYLASQEGLEKMYLAASQIRSFGEIYPRKSMVDKLSSNEIIKPFITVADKAEDWYLASKTFDNGINDEMSKYFGDAINKVAIESKDPEEVLPDLRKGIDQLVQKYQIKR